MTLPEFDSFGNLPEAVYHCDITDLRSHFVAPFPASAERQRILNGFIELREVYESLGVSATQWVNGSFTTRKLNPDDPSEELEPGDIDVVTFIDADVLNNYSVATQQTLYRLIDCRGRTKEAYRTHSMGMPYFAVGHQRHGLYEVYRVFWRDRFSRHSPPSKRGAGDINLPYPADSPRKGFISLTLGDPTLAPRIDDQRL